MLDRERERDREMERRARLREFIGASLLDEDTDNDLARPLDEAPVTLASL